jgi:hypothetical protein
MTELTITGDDDAVIIQQDGLTVLETDQTQIEIIQTFDQGPPGVRGPPGPQGIPGPEGVAEAPMDGQTYGRKLSLWVPFGGITACSVGDTAPDHAPDGSLWFETDSGLLFLKYNDGDSTQWVVTPKVGGISDGPQDGNAYGRQDGDWARVAPLSSPQFVNNPTAPTQTLGKNDNSLATTAFVQSAIAIGGTGPSGGGGPLPASSVIVTPTGNVSATDAQSAITELDSEKVAKAGDAMTGLLVLSAAPTIPNHAATKAYVDTAITPIANKVDKGGDTMTGPLTLSGAPSSGSQATTKDYVDAAVAPISGKVSKAGDTMTGALTVLAPTQPGHAATKSYVDSAASVGGNYVAKSGDTMTGGLTIQTNLSVAGSSSLGATTVNGTLTVGSNVVYSNQFRMNGTTHSIVYDGTNTIIRQGSGSTYFQRGDGGANFAWIDNAGGFTVTGNGQINQSLNISVNLTVGGTFYAHDIYCSRSNGMGVIYFGGGTNNYLFWNGSNYQLTGGVLATGNCILGGTPNFSPTNPGAAGLRTGGAYGGGLTLQDGSYWGMMYCTGGDLVLATGTGPSTKLTISNAGNHLFSGNLNVSGDILNCYGTNFYLSNAPCINRSGPFTAFYDGDSNQRIILGNNASTVNYHRNNNHFFQDPSGSVNYATIQDGNFGVNGTGWKPGGGSWADSSDERIKRVVGKYRHGLDEILALNPVRYVYKGNDTVELPSGAEAPFTNSTHRAAAQIGKEFIGLVAQEAEVSMPELVTASTAYLDGVRHNDVRVLDPSALVFALINAVKTLTARIEELERDRDV